MLANLGQNFSSGSENETLLLVADFFNRLCSDAEGDAGADGDDAEAAHGEGMDDDGDTTRLSPPLNTLGDLLCGESSKRPVSGMLQETLDTFRTMPLDVRGVFGASVATSGAEASVDRQEMPESNVGAEDMCSKPWPASAKAALESNALPPFRTRA
jgi:hypothetical protein